MPVEPTFHLTIAGTDCRYREVNPREIHAPKKPLAAGQQANAPDYIDRDRTVFNQETHAGDTTATLFMLRAKAFDPEGVEDSTPARPYHDSYVIQSDDRIVRGRSSLPIVGIDTGTTTKAFKEGPILNFLASKGPVNQVYMDGVTTDASDKEDVIARAVLVLVSQVLQGKKNINLNAFSRGSVCSMVVVNELERILDALKATLERNIIEILEEAHSGEPKLAQRMQDLMLQEREAFHHLQVLQQTAADRQVDLATLTDTVTVDGTLLDPVPGGRYRGLNERWHNDRTYTLSKLWRNVNIVFAQDETSRCFKPILPKIAPGSNTNLRIKSLPSNHSVIAGSYTGQNGEQLFPPGTPEHNAVKSLSKLVQIDELDYFAATRSPEELTYQVANLDKTNNGPWVKDYLAMDADQRELEQLRLYRAVAPYKAAMRREMRKYSYGTGQEETIQTVFGNIPTGWAQERIMHVHSHVDVTADKVPGLLAHGQSFVNAEHLNLELKHLFGMAPMVNGVASLPARIERFKALIETACSDSSQIIDACNQPGEAGKNAEKLLAETVGNMVNDIVQGILHADDLKPAERGEIKDNFTALLTKLGELAQSRRVGALWFIWGENEGQPLAKSLQKHLPEMINSSIASFVRRQKLLVALMLKDAESLNDQIKKATESTAADGDEAAAAEKAREIRELEELKADTTQKIHETQAYLKNLTERFEQQTIIPATGQTPEGYDLQYFVSVRKTIEDGAHELDTLAERLAEIGRALNPAPAPAPTGNAQADAVVAVMEDPWQSINTQMRQTSDHRFTPSPADSDSDAQANQLRVDSRKRTQEDAEDDGKKAQQEDPAFAVARANAQDLDDTGPTVPYTTPAQGGIPAGQAPYFELDDFAASDEVHDSEEEEDCDDEATASASNIVLGGEPNFAAAAALLEQQKQRHHRANRLGGDLLPPGVSSGNGAHAMVAADDDGHPTPSVLFELGDGNPVHKSPEKRNPNEAQLVTSMPASPTTLLNDDKPAPVKPLSTVLQEVEELKTRRQAAGSSGGTAQRQAPNNIQAADLTTLNNIRTGMHDALEPRVTLTGVIDRHKGAALTVADKKLLLEAYKRVIEVELDSQCCSTTLFTWMFNSCNKTNKLGAVTVEIAKAEGKQTQPADTALHQQQLDDGLLKRVCGR